VLFATTRGAHLVPWTSWADPVVDRDPGSVVSFHVPAQWRDRLLRSTQVHFVRTLFAENRGTIAQISDFLRMHAARGDVVVTNYAWEALYFHTGLPQGAKLSPEFPIYQVARSRALPDYVFGTDRVRWNVWRQALPEYFPEQDCAALLARLKKAGITTELVATIRETGFENRENVHFRRYAGETYVFPWHKQLDDALIYRVDWESDVESRHQRADVHFEAGRYQEAITDYDYYVARRPGDWQAFARLGVSQLIAGSPLRAVAAMQRAVEFAPVQVGPHRNLANVLVDTGDPSAALEHARTAVQLRPDDAGAHAVLGRALADTGDATAALPHFERALELNPDEPDVRDRLARIRTRPR
jgi:Flp pilus assembly protein TadD